MKDDYNAASNKSYDKLKRQLNSISLTEPSMEIKKGHNQRKKIHKNMRRLMLTSTSSNIYCHFLDKFPIFSLSP